ncbi:uncharacterized protein N7443_004311 [Penicillium atrosanguineum]|uniref:uncharacterized protein n=1 Tax=Penicillium atrosanguineum TaxID=1132637 RepID=UPI002392F1BC|nr:uncharacterized protein N7443_004311 [Penicillium atrosanguineum]KAJ5304651.1 hypothetical protein N7443_004311 [Penicillium atrosanguineum]
MDVDMRLRKAFRYPDESEDEREELDEEQQERVIQQLQCQNEARNAQYNDLYWNSIGINHHLYTLDPICLDFRRGFSVSLGHPLAGGLGLHYEARPLYPDRKGKKPLLADDERLTWLLSALVPVNGAVCLVLMAYFFIEAGSSYTIRPVLYLIPSAILAVILLAREMMLSVDLSTLKALQYEYKGA